MNRIYLMPGILSKKPEDFDLAQWLREQLNYHGVAWVAPACDEDSCPAPATSPLATAVTALIAQNTAQNVIIADLTARIEALENP